MDAGSLAVVQVAPRVLMGDESSPVQISMQPSPGIEGLGQGGLWCSGFVVVCFPMGALLAVGERERERGEEVCG